MNITQIIWSRDRACQLDLLLRSTEKFFPIKTKVLWKASNDFFYKGYQKLFKKKRKIDIEYIPEINFKADLIKIITQSNSDYILGNSDDNIFIRKVGFENIIENMWADKIVAFSLRLGKKLNYCQPANLQMQEPEYELNGLEFLVWDWTKGDKRVCWYYPQPCDSNIYKKDYFFNLIKDGQFINPKQLEDWMNNHRPEDKPYMISFDKPHLINIAANQTGQGNNLPCGRQSLEYLNQTYLDGYQIIHKDFINIDVNACHIVKEYFFEKI